MDPELFLKFRHSRASQTDKEPSKDSSDFLESIEEEKKDINFKKELVFYFYNSMFNEIIENVEPYIDESTESTATTSKVLKCHPYVPYTEKLEEKYLGEEVLVEEEDDPKYYHGHKKSSRFSTKLKKNFSKKRLVSKSRSLLSTKKIKKVKANSKNWRKPQNLKFSNAKPKKYDKWIIEPVYEAVSIEFINGNCYTGNMYRKKMHGQGKFTWTDGSVYIGDFVDGEITGKGRFEYPEKTVYEGEFYRGYANGVGVENPYDCPGMYTGEWRIGKKHGKGLQIFEPNNWYEGQWECNKMHGYGTRHYTSGAMYEGNWINGKRHGYGIAIMSNKDYYSGEWVNGKKEGYGEYIWKAFYNATFSVPIENKYEGMWKNDLMHGVGIRNFGSKGGFRYAGNYMNNMKNGAGMIICDNGTVINGDPLFLQDKLVFGSDYTKVPKTDCLEYNQNVCSQNAQKLDEEVPNLQNSTETKTVAILKIKNKNLSPGGYSQNRKEFLANHNLYEKMFPKQEITYLDTSSLSVDFPYEKINLDVFIADVIKKYNEVDEEDKENFPSDHLFEMLQIWPQLLPQKCQKKFTETKKKLNTEKFDMKENEEKQLRTTFMLYLKDLKKYYDNYALVGTIYDRDKVKFDSSEAWLLRIFLWQLYRDIELPKKGISLIETDLLLMKHSSVTLLEKHNPFEVIYFWQFLTSLLQVAVTLYVNECLHCVQRGILSAAFEKFMITDFLPNIGQHKGSALFEYKDVIPLQAAYDWYKSLGEPHTIIDFIKNSCTIKNGDPLRVFRTNINYVPPNIKMGKNIFPVGDTMSYLVEPRGIGQPPEKPLKAYTHDFFIDKLFFLRELGPKNILKVFENICSFRVDNDIVNLDYKLSFLEFYEAVLVCTQQKIKMVDNDVEPPKLGQWTRINLLKKKKVKITKKKKSISK